MAVVNEKSSFITNLDAEPRVLAAPGEYGGIVRYTRILHEITAGDSATSTYQLIRLPSNTRILGQSTLYWDDLASTGSPTGDLGVSNATGLSAITNDPDALNDGLALSTASTGSPLIKTIDNYGKRLWEFVNGQTVDPKGDLEIYLSIVDADVNTGGTFVLELFHAYD